MRRRSTISARRFTLGDGVEQDDRESGKWFRLAADQGLPEAQHALGTLYELGEGVPRDGVKAVQLYRRAAEQGYAPAQYAFAAWHDSTDDFLESPEFCREMVPPFR